MALPVCGKHVFILRLLGRFEQISRLSFLNAMMSTCPSSPRLSSSDSSTETTGGNKSVKANKILKVTPKKRKQRPMDYIYTGNIYMLPQRAMFEFILKPGDLDRLPKYMRRNPYGDGHPSITVFLRSDVEVVAKQVWGCLENIRNEHSKMHAAFYPRDERPIDDNGDKSDINSNCTNEQPCLFPGYIREPSPQSMFWQSGSARVVISAILVNTFNSFIKLIAWLYTGSHSMFSEFIHSLADTMNQAILGIGLYHSIKKPDPDHPYGYSNLRNISSLISGVGVFFLGTGLSVYHGIQGFIHPEPLTSINWGIAALVGALVSESATLIIAANQVRKGSQKMGIRFWQYVFQAEDPNVSIVLLEDMAAVFGVTVAGASLALSTKYETTIPDAVGSCVIGAILGVVATIVISTNTSALMGKSIPYSAEQRIIRDLEGDVMIRSLHDIKTTRMGGQIRFKAEVDFDGKEITRAYLYKQDLDLLLTEVRGIHTTDDLEAFFMSHGERIVDTLGEELDRIEQDLKRKHPQVRHVDLEAL